MLYEELTKEIIGAAQEVHRQLKFGFLESVYEKALSYELTSRGIKNECQKRLQVKYKGVVVGDYVADMVVADKVILELKAVSDLRPEHEYQLLNYLTACDMELGLLINFGHSVQVKRRIRTKQNP